MMPCMVLKEAKGAGPVDVQTVGFRFRMLCGLLLVYKIKTLQPT